MGKLILGLIIGLVIGGGGALVLGGGAMMGAGVATGLSAGMCSTLSAAQDAGLVTAEQADQVLLAATQKLADVDVSETGPLVGSSDGCEEVLANLKAAS